MPSSAHTRTGRRVHAVMLAILFAAAVSASARPHRADSADLSQYRHKSRLLFILAPSPDDGRYTRQSGSLRGQEDGLKERDLIRVDVFETGASRRGETELTAREAAALRQRFQMAKGQFKIVLLDKDGHAAFSAKSPAPASQLFAAIDATPLRRYEARTRKKPQQGAGAGAKAAAQNIMPSKLLTPEQVVKIQMEALQHNDVPKPDSGIAKTFDFASPSNKQATGPLDHFALIVKGSAYLPMLNCKKIDYDPIVVEGGRAQQRVHIVAADGSRITYVFLLSLQTEGKFVGCWMNDGCVRDDAEEENHRFDA